MAYFAINDPGVPLPTPRSSGPPSTAGAVISGVADVPLPTPRHSAPVSTAKAIITGDCEVVNAPVAAKVQTGAGLALAGNIPEEREEMEPAAGCA